MTSEYKVSIGAEVDLSSAKSEFNAFVKEVSKKAIPLKMDADKAAKKARKAFEDLSKNAVRTMGNQSIRSFHADTNEARKAGAVSIIDDTRTQLGNKIIEWYRAKGVEIKDVDAAIKKFVADATGNTKNGSKAVREVKDALSDKTSLSGKKKAYGKFADSISDAAVKHGIDGIESILQNGEDRLNLAGQGIVIAIENTGTEVAQAINEVNNKVGQAASNQSGFDKAAQSLKEGGNDVSQAGTQAAQEIRGAGDKVEQAMDGVQKSVRFKRFKVETDVDVQPRLDIDNDKLNSEIERVLNSSANYGKHKTSKQQLYEAEKVLKSIDPNARVYTSETSTKTDVLFNGVKRMFKSQSDAYSAIGEMMLAAESASNKAASEISSNNEKIEGSNEEVEASVKEVRGALSTNVPTPDLSSGIKAEAEEVENAADIIKRAMDKIRSYYSGSDLSGMSNGQIIDRLIKDSGISQSEAGRMHYVYAGGVDRNDATFAQGFEYMVDGAIDSAQKQSASQTEAMVESLDDAAKGAASSVEGMSDALNGVSSNATDGVVNKMNEVKNATDGLSQAQKNAASSSSSMTDDLKKTGEAAEKAGKKVNEAREKIELLGNAEPNKLFSTGGSYPHNEPDIRGNAKQEPFEEVGIRQDEWSRYIGNNPELSGTKDNVLRWFTKMANTDVGIAEAQVKLDKASSTQEIETAVRQYNQIAAKFEDVYEKYKLASEEKEKSLVKQENETIKRLNENAGKINENIDDNGHVKDKDLDDQLTKEREKLLKEQAAIAKKRSDLDTETHQVEKHLQNVLEEGQRRVQTANARYNDKTFDELLKLQGKASEKERQIALTDPDDLERLQKLNHELDEINGKIADRESKLRVSGDDSGELDRLSQEQRSRYEEVKQNRAGYVQDAIDAKAEADALKEQSDARKKAIRDYKDYMTEKARYEKDRKIAASKGEDTSALDRNIKDLDDMMANIRVKFDIDENSVAEIKAHKEKLERGEIVLDAKVESDKVDSDFETLMRKIRELNKAEVKLASMSEFDDGFEDAQRAVNKLRAEVNGLENDLGRVSKFNQGKLNNDQHRQYSEAMSKMAVDTQNAADELTKKQNDEAQKVIKSYIDKDTKFGTSTAKLIDDYDKIAHKSATAESAMQGFYQAQALLEDAIRQNSNAFDDNVASGDRVITNAEAIINAQRVLEQAYDEATEAVKQNKAESARAEANQKFLLSQEKALTSMDAWAKKNDRVMNGASAQAKELAQEFIELRRRIQECDNAADLANLNTELSTFKNKVKAAGLEGESTFTRLKNKFAEYASYAVASMGIMEVVQGLKMMANEVLEVDTAMTGLLRVTEMTNSETEAMFDRMVDSAKEYGRTLTDTINATADWVRAGFDENTALGLAEVTAMYQNVSDLDYDEAAENLLTSYNGFKEQLSGDYEGDTVAAVEHITDVLNELDK